MIGECWRQKAFKVDLGVMNIYQYQIPLKKAFT